LPEFDALLCGYEPKARDRFVTPEQHAALWHSANGLVRAPALHEGRLAGWWRLEGPARARRLVVTPLQGGVGPSEADLEPALVAACTAMGWEVSDIAIDRG